MTAHEHRCPVCQQPYGCTLDDCATADLRCFLCRVRGRLQGGAVRTNTQNRATRP